MTRTIGLLLVGLLLSVSASAHGPSRQKITETININASADKVWQLVADFCAIEQWQPGIHKCIATGGNQPGGSRVLVIGEDGGPEIHEELLKYDAEKMTYKYKITKTDNKILPVITYSAFFTVRDAGENMAEVEWRSGFYRAYPNNNPPPELNDEAAVKAVTGSYTAGLAALKALAEQ